IRHGIWGGFLLESAGAKKVGAATLQIGGEVGKMLMARYNLPRPRQSSHHDAVAATTLRLPGEAPDVRLSANRHPALVLLLPRPAAGSARRLRSAGRRPLSGPSYPVPESLLRPLPQPQGRARRAESGALHLRRRAPGGLPPVGARRHLPEKGRDASQKSEAA